MSEGKRLYYAALAVVEIYERQAARAQRHCNMLQLAANLAKSGARDKAEQLKRQVDREKIQVFCYEDALKELKAAIDILRPKHEKP